jgi:hypothetical protein
MNYFVIPVKTGILLYHKTSAFAEVTGVYVIFEL